MTKAMVPHQEPQQDLQPASTWQNLEGTAAAATSMLRSPASGTACVYWRLRVTETIAPTVFVHDVCSDEAFELQVPLDSGLPPRLSGPLRINGREARIDALAILHRPDSVAAKAVATAFGLTGQLTVEEVVIPVGARLEVSGALVGAAAAGPFRSAPPEYALTDVTVKVPGNVRRNQFLPWAVGTGAAILSVLGVAGAVARNMDVAPIGRHLAKAFFHGEVVKPKPPYRRWP